VAETWLELVYEVGSTMPPSSIAVFAWKFVPLTVRVSGPEPAATDAGLMEVIVGVGVVPPPEVPELEVEEPPPQEARLTDTPRPRNRTTNFDECMVHGSIGHASLSLCKFSNYESNLLEVL
jgi:hypothetical protein